MFKKWEIIDILIVAVPILPVSEDDLLHQYPSTTYDEGGSSSAVFLSINSRTKLKKATSQGMGEYQQH